MWENPMVESKSGYHISNPFQHIDNLLEVFAKFTRKLIAKRQPIGLHGDM
jgi:hypothetical protein